MAPLRKNTAFRVTRLVFLVMMILAIAILAREIKVRREIVRSFDFQVRFTNPICAKYKYSTLQYTRSGEEITSLPLDAYCSSADATRMANDTATPLAALLSLINSPGTTEIFTAFRGFTNEIVGVALCEAIQSRGLKLTMIVDPKRPEQFEQAKALESCGSNLTPPRIIEWNSPSGQQLSVAFMLINPSDANTRTVFSSGYLGEGIGINHENWNFVKASRHSVFAHDHICLRDSLLGGVFAADIFRNCRSSFNERQKDSIELFLTPVDSVRLMDQFAVALSRAHSIDLAGLRFSSKLFFRAIKARLEAPDNFSARLLFDDDMYWAEQMQVSRELKDGLGEVTADRLTENDFSGISTRNVNATGEAIFVRELRQVGAQVRYLHTNASVGQAQNNRLIIFRNGAGLPFAVMTGSGNFTQSAIERNLENFYWLRHRPALEAYAQQFEALWGDLSTALEAMPVGDVAPEVSLAQ